MVKQAKENAKAFSNDTTVAFKNLVRLVESAALLVVAVYAIYGAYHYKVNQALTDVLIIAGVIIGLRGAWELLRHLAEKDRQAPKVYIGGKVNK